MLDKVKWFVKAHSGQIAILAITGLVMGLIAGSGLESFARRH